VNFANQDEKKTAGFGSQIGGSSSASLSQVQALSGGSASSLKDASSGQPEKVAVPDDIDEEDLQSSSNSEDNDAIEDAMDDLDELEKLAEESSSGSDL